MAGKGKTEQEKLFIYHTYIEHGIDKSLSILKEHFDKISKTTIRRIQKEVREKYNLPKRDNSDSYRKYSLDKNYFEIIDSPDKAYWIGFIAADGSVYPPERRLSVHIARKDRDHLAKLNICLKTDRPVENIIKFDKRYQEYRESSRISYNSSKLLTDLKPHGIVRNKTRVYTPQLNQIAPIFHRDF